MQSELSKENVCPRRLGRIDYSRPSPGNPPRPDHTFQALNSASKDCSNLTRRRAALCFRDDPSWGQVGRHPKLQRSPLLLTSECVVPTGATVACIDTPPETYGKFGWMGSEGVGTTTKTHLFLKTPASPNGLSSFQNCTLCHCFTRIPSSAVWLGRADTTHSTRGPYRRRREARREHRSFREVRNLSVPLLEWLSPGFWTRK